MYELIDAGKLWQKITGKDMDKEFKQTGLE
jgi:hypothetical protein